MMQVFSVSVDHRHLELPAQADDRDDPTAQVDRRPARSPGSAGTLVMPIMPLISWTLRISSPYSSWPRTKERYLPAWAVRETVDSTDIAYLQLGGTGRLFPGAQTPALTATPGLGHGQRPAGSGAVTAAAFIRPPGRVVSTACATLTSPAMSRINATLPLDMIAAAGHARRCPASSRRGS